MRSDKDDRVDRRLAEIDALVDTEDFVRIKQLVQSLPDLVASIQEADRKKALYRIQGVLKNLRFLAEWKSEHVRAELNNLRSGRVATTAYRESEMLTIADSPRKA
jgi:hypothetical protein